MLKVKEVAKNWPEKHKYPQMMLDCDTIQEAYLNGTRHGENKMIDEISNLETRMEMLDEEKLFEIISAHNTGNPDRFYNPKAMNEDRELALMICEKFASPAPRVLSVEQIRFIATKARDEFWSIKKEFMEPAISEEEMVYMAIHAKLSEEYVK